MARVDALTACIGANRRSNASAHARAEIAGEIRHTLETAGETIGSLDMLIAAHARAVGAILVTNNITHFGRVPGLKVENWATGA